MGSYDTVFQRCPNRCGGYVEFQSKGGDCNFRKFNHGDPVPLDVAGDCDIGYCDTCDGCFKCSAFPSTVTITVIPKDIDDPND